MTPIHEIAFLVLSGALSCWTWSPSENSCPNADSIQISAYEKPDLKMKPAKSIDRNSFNSYMNTEVGYEEKGFAVFKTEGNDWHQIMNTSGEKFWVHLPSLEKQFQSTADKTSKQKSWRFEKIENLVGQGMSRVDDDFSKYLRQEDLKTPMQIPKNLVAQIHKRQLQLRLKETSSELPTSYIEISLPCTYQEISPGKKQGTCQPVPKIATYEKPESGAPSVMISMTWANWAGKSISQQEKILERLFIFAEKNDWLKIQVAFGENEKRIRWVKKTDLKKYKIQLLPEAEQIPSLIHILESTNRADTAQRLKGLAPQPGFSATGRTKWSTDGVLYGEVNIQDFPACSTEEPKTLMKAWLPYKLEKKSAPILSWYSRGC